jgi:hypothetical protein
MSLFFANIWGWIVAHKRLVIYTVLAMALALLLFFAYRGCKGGKKATIDLEGVTKINSVDRAERLKELEKVITENQDVIATADNRTTLAEQDIVTRNREIARKVAEADKAIENAKSHGRDVTQQELECLLTPKECE